MNEKIMSTMIQLGFDLKELDDDVYEFSYEGVGFLLITQDDDDFVQFCISFGHVGGSLPVLDYYKLLNTFNSTYKYIKFIENHELLFLCYERQIFSGEDLNETIPSMIFQLENVFRSIFKMLHELEDDQTDDEEKTAEAYSEMDEDTACI